MWYLIIFLIYGIVQNENVTLYQFPKEVFLGGFTHLSSSFLDTNLLWIMGRKNLKVGFEFDLKEKKWEEIEFLSKTGASLGDGIWKDAVYGELLWIYNSYRGFTIFNSKNNSIVDTFVTKELRYRHNSEFVMIFTKDLVWIGIDNKLFCYRRKNKKIMKIKEFSGLRIRNIYLYEKKLIINKVLLFNPLNRKIIDKKDEKWPFMEEIVEFKGDCKIFRDNIREQLIVKYKDKKIYVNVSCYESSFFEKPNILWLFSYNRIVRINLYTKEVDYFHGIKDYRMSNFKIKGNFVYFKFSGRYHKNIGIGRLNILNKNIQLFFDSSAIDFWIYKDRVLLLSKNGIKETKMSFFVRGSLSASEFEERMHEFKNIYSKLKRMWGSDDVFKKLEITERLYRMAKELKEKYRVDLPWDMGFVGRYLASRNKEQLNEVERLLKTENDAIKREVYYTVLALNLLLVGDPDGSYKYYLKLKKEYPENEFLKIFYPEDIERLKRASKRYKEILSSNLKEDEKLWLLGEMFYDALKMHWNATEVYWNLAYAKNFFLELISKYPHSKWADNAEFKILVDMEGAVHEGGDINMLCIKDYKNFIKKYPESELLPYAMDEISRHYLSYIDIMKEDFLSKYDTFYAYLDTALTYGKKIVALSNISDTNLIKKTRQNIKYLENIKEMYCVDFKISSDKKEYTLDEPVIITFTIMNLGKKNKEIKAQKGFPNLAISVKKEAESQEYIYRHGRYKPAEFIQNYDINVPKSKKVVVIRAKGGVYKEKQDIKKLTIKKDLWFDKYGKFVFEKGRYRIRGYAIIYWNRKIIRLASNEITIEISE